MAIGQMPGDPGGARQCESLSAVLTDVEDFARDWIGRVRSLIHQSSQLIERETLLAGAIARLDQQKADWNRRTAAKEEHMRDQAKRLTEAWLEVESERRKQIQGAQVQGAQVQGAGAASLGGAASAGAQASVTSPAQGNMQVPAQRQAPAQGLAPAQSLAPAQGYAQSHPQPSASVAHAQRIVGPSQSTDGPAPIPAQQPAPQVAPRGPVMATVTNAPVASGFTPSVSVGESVSADAVAEAQKRQRIEEFRRMQRSIQSNRNT